MQHSFGWPLGKGSAAARSSTITTSGLVAVGFVVHLNYQNPTLSPFDEFQRFKTHPLIRGTFEGGKRLAYGARAISSGGWQSVPKLVFPGGALIGCAAGFLNFARIKGSHNAVLSGMLAAETAHDALAAGRAHDELTAYEDGWRASDIGRDLFKVRNVKPLWSQARPRRRRRSAGFDMWTNELFGFSLFGTLKHGKAGQRDAEAARRGQADRLSQAGREDLVRQGVFGLPLQHQPRGGPADPPRLRDPAVPIRDNLPRYGEPARLYCPGGRLRGRLCRRGQARRSALRHQRAELRALQDLRHQGPRAEHRLDAAGGRRRAELSRHVKARRPLAPTARKRHFA